MKKSTLHKFTPSKENSKYF